MSSKAKASPKKKPTPKGSPAGGVTKPKVARSGTMTRTAKDAERFLKKTKFEDKTTPMALRGSKTKMGEVESINKNLTALTKEGNKKRRLTALERTALEGSAFALKAEQRARRSSKK